MKLTLQKKQGVFEEVIIRYSEMTDEIEDIIHYIEFQGKDIIGIKEGQQFKLPIKDIIYIESVDGNTYIYTKEDVYKTNITLTVFSSNYEEFGFFRCSKSMVICISRIESLKSLEGNKIDAKLENGEHVLISRRYAKEFRSILKGEA